MSLTQQIRTILARSLTNNLTLIANDNIKQVVYPVAAPTLAVSDGAALAWAWSAYVQIIAAANIPNPSWLVGVFMSTPTVEAFTADFAIATGAGGAEVDQAIFPFNEDLFAVVEGKSVTQYLPYPIRLVGQPRLSVRVRKSTAVSAAGVSLKVILATGVGT